MKPPEAPNVVRYFVMDQRGNILQVPTIAKWTEWRLKSQNLPARTLKTLVNEVTIKTTFTGTSLNSPLPEWVTEMTTTGDKILAKEKLNGDFDDARTAHDRVVQRIKDAQINAEKTV